MKKAVNQKKSPEISYIVSAFNRPDQLRTLLASLAAQTHQEFEVIVTDNNPDRYFPEIQHRLVTDLKDSRFRYFRTFDKIPVSDPYWSAEWGMIEATGKWLCFPCDDIYYPPEWAQRMLLRSYQEPGGLDLILCENILCGPQTNCADNYQRYVVGTYSFPGYKPSFLIKKDKFSGWVNKATTSPTCSGVDRTTLTHLIGNGAVKWGVARDLYYFHN